MAKQNLSEKAHLQQTMIEQMLCDINYAASNIETLSSLLIDEISTNEAATALACSIELFSKQIGFLSEKAHSQIDTSNPAFRGDSDQYFLSNGSLKIIKSNGFDKKLK